MRFLFWKALIGLLAFDILGRDFGRMLSFVRHWKVLPGRADPGAVDRVCDAVNLACSWYPKRARCLQRSAVTTCLLRNYGLAAQMVLGAQRAPFKAHAWVEVEGRVVNDKSYTAEMFAVLDRC